MNKKAFWFTGMLILTGIGHSATIPGLFNTGVDALGNPLPNNAPDTHYTLVSVPGGTTAVRAANSSNGFPIGPWLGDDSLSSWIGPASDPSLDGPAGNYDYQTTFNLTGLVPSTVSITGQWATDNSGVDILINGNSVGATAAGFGSWYTFSINSGFQAGVNTLDFIVNNISGPTGLRVEMTGTASPIPEPASLALLGFGVAGLALLRRRFTA